MARPPSIQDGPLWRSFLMFLLPLIGQNILQSLGMTINSIVVGQMLGTGALAAVATFMPLAFFFIAFYKSSDPFMANNWVEIALVDYSFKVMICLLFFLPMYGVLLNMLLKRIAARSGSIDGDRQTA